MFADGARCSLIAPDLFFKEVSEHWIALGLLCHFRHFCQHLVEILGVLNDGLQH